jgi:hypothetical protein
MYHRAVWFMFTDISEVLAAAISRRWMEAASIPETSVNFHQITWRKNPEEGHLHSDILSGSMHLIYLA